MTVFTPFESLLGGVLIGLSAVLLMLNEGRIAGMTGIVAGVIRPRAPDQLWRYVFLAGAVLAPLIMGAIGFVPGFTSPASHRMLMLGGFLVGFGALFGGGCPSGHGVCGLPRLSVRSIVATIVFMATAMLTVFVTRHVL